MDKPTSFSNLALELDIHMIWSIRQFGKMEICQWKQWNTMYDGYIVEFSCVRMSIKLIDQHVHPPIYKNIDLPLNWDLI